MDPNVKDKTKKTNIGTGLIIVLLCFLISTTAVAFFFLNRDTIYDGVTIENLDVGGLSITEAQNKIQNHFDQLVSDGKIHFIYGDKAWDSKSSDIGYTYDYTKALKDAYEVGREGNYFERLQKIFSLYKIPHDISLIPIYDTTKVDGIIHDMQRTIEKSPKEATIRRRNGKFVITDEVTGLHLNADKTKSLLTEELKNYKFQNEIKIELPVETVSPRMTSESLSTIGDLLGEYTTKFNASSKSRTQNILLAAKSVNGTVIMPEETFSFNKVVGPRSKERGYQDAPVIFKGELVEGLGGGVCQASSTLYNAVLLSNLEIVERYKHTIPSSYVPKGQDATVSYGVLDFKFKNIGPYPIYLESYVENNLMKVKVYGNRVDNKVIKIQSEEKEVVKRPIEIKYDSNLMEGKEKIEQEGRDGYKIVTYKITYENGKIVEKKQISNDYYKPQKQIIIKGTKKTPISHDTKVEQSRGETDSSQ